MFRDCPQGGYGGGGGLRGGEGGGGYGGDRSLMQTQHQQYLPLQDYIFKNPLPTGSGMTSSSMVLSNIPSLSSLSLQPSQESWLVPP